MAGKDLFYYQRRVGTAYVEKDLLVYERSKRNGKYRLVNRHWQAGLPSRLPDGLIARQDAERVATAHVPGEVLFSSLYYLSPDTDVYRGIVPLPTGPVWSVSINSAQSVRHIAVIDARTGTFLGESAPPPAMALSLSGPLSSGPCYDWWGDWYGNARDWFQTMGYSTDALIWPTHDTIDNYMRSDVTTLYYHLAHGYPLGFNTCTADGQSYWLMSVPEIDQSMASSTKWPFAFLGSCDGMCDVGPGTLSNSFRKGETTNTTTVGYCGMSQSQCSSCWNFSVRWQNLMFQLMSQGATVKAAFDVAVQSYPMCAPCVRFAGDQSFSVVPQVHRKNWVDLSLFQTNPPYSATVMLRVDEYGPSVQNGTQAIADPV